MHALPGDAHIEDPFWYADQSIVLRAEPSEVWPWLAQMGNGRAGWYSYDWLDNFGKRSYRHIDPALQELQVGQKVSVFEVSEFNAPDFLTLSVSPRANMTWVLKPHASGSELITRLRVAGPRWLLAVTLGPGHYIMQRKQFLEIKKRTTREHPNDPTRAHW